MRSSSARTRSTKIAPLRVVVVVAFLLFGALLLAAPRELSATFGASVDPVPTPRPRARATPKPRRYSQFPHNIKAHGLECSSCHKFPSENWNKVRTGEAAFPDITEYPKHESCLSCHRQQFFKGATPAICSICHVDPFPPRNSARHPFPNPREIFDGSAKGKNAVSDFVVSFPHDKHIDIVSDTGRRRVGITKVSWALNKRRAEESCAVCHTTYQPQGDAGDEYVTKPPATLGDGFWLKKGTFKTAPISHTRCFSCHSADSGLEPAASSCATCHKIKPSESRTDFDLKVAATMGITDKITLNAWKRRDSSATFRHEWFSHAELSCARCHNVTAMNTVDPATTKVAIASCSGCHATATSDEGGALNFELDSRKADPKFQCVKCHISFGKLPVPESHVKAVAAVIGQ